MKTTTKTAPYKKTRGFVGIARNPRSRVPITPLKRTTTNARALRVFAVRSLTTKKVTVGGTLPLAFVASGEIAIRGEFSVSGTASGPGPGALNNDSCKGKAIPYPRDNTVYKGGAGGGGFGKPGGAAGGVASGTVGAAEPDSESLVPLTGGCDGGPVVSSINKGEIIASAGTGGGAIQLVSKTKIAVDGSVASNGSGGAGGGGSGGGILLEAPLVQVSGSVVANGGAGGGCNPGAAGNLNAEPAAGGGGCDRSKGGLFTVYGWQGGGGSGGSARSNAMPGENGSGIGRHGSGGGGVGYIRINTAPSGFRDTGIVSPSASLGTLVGH